METFAVSETEFPRPKSLLELAQLIGKLARAGYIVVLDEFQYFSRTKLSEFNSHLQAVVDGLVGDSANVPGGLFVLGSIHTELVALLEDRDAPLYNRATDHLELDHLDIASVLAILRSHADERPERLLFLWNLFEGVPKFYRDCFEQGVLGAERRDLLSKMFFRSSSPLRTEAENWFLSELRGRYDVVLKFLAKNPGCNHGELEGHVRDLNQGSSEQVAGYVKILIERYRMIEKRLPILSAPRARKSRYYIRDNFLRAWLAALANQVAAIDFRPVDELIKKADERLRDSEGFGLERLVGALYGERSRRGVLDFNLTQRIEGYWDRSGTEIDLVAVDDMAQKIRFGSCKRSATKIRPDLDNFDGHVQRFLDAKRSYQTWTIEKAVFAPSIDDGTRGKLAKAGYLPQDLVDLTADL
jgi:hypothetical protein